MLLVLVLGVGASFAADTNQTHIQASDDTDTAVSISETNAVSSNDDEVYSAGNDSDVLSATTGSFTELSTLINSSTTGSITLDRNYTYNSATDSAFVEGIIINRTISIDGAGFTINGNGESRILHIIGSNVLIRDVNFIKGYSTGNLGAVLWEGDNGYLVASTFKNNTGANYAAVLWRGSYGSIASCTFKENVATANCAGLCVSSQSTETTISACTFEKNHAVNRGAAQIDCTYATMTNCIFNENYASTNVGAVYWSGSQGNMKNCEFNNNHANNYGAIQWAGSYAIINTCSFENNYATTSVGAILLGGTNSRISNSTFIENQARNGHSGAFHLTGTGSYVLDCNFIKNTATTTGGAFYSTIDYGHISNTTFDGNNATNGGAVYSSSRNPRVLNCTFKNNYASQSGGAMSIPSSVINCLFENNKADVNGGAIQILGDGTNILNNTFKRNTASNGGALSIPKNKCYVYNSIFEDNIATTNGGAIYSNGNYIFITESTFNGNVANNLGGGVYNGGNYFSVSQSTFSGNTATSNSGAIYVASGKSVYLEYTLKTTSDTVNATGAIMMPFVLYASPSGTSSGTGTQSSPMDIVTALNNVANGGTVYVMDGTYTVSSQLKTYSKTLNIIGLGSPILEFSATLNAAHMYIEGPSCVVRNIIFRKGNVNNQYVIHGDGTQYTLIENCTFDETGIIWFGGRFWDIKDSTIKNIKSTKGSAIQSNFYMEYITNCTFINNTATNGGAIYANKQGWFITNCTFINNTVSKNGGAIFVSDYIVSVTGCKFINNTAGEKGGAIYTSGQELEISNCTFSGNNAPDGGAVYLTGLRTAISDSDFSNNNASNGGAVYSSGREVSVSDSNFTGNGASEQGGAVYSTGTGASVSGSNFGENSATNGSAVMVGENTDITIEGSDFNNNSGNGSVYVPEGSNFVIDSETTFENNEGGDLVTPGVVSAKVLYVNVTATGDGLLATGPTNWELGFANVQDEGTLYVLPGTYDMSQLSPIVVDRSLSIIGLGDVVFTNYVRGQLFDIQADNVKLSNIKFTGITGNYITWNGINGEIESCNFDGSNTNGNYKLITTTLTSTNFKVTNSNFTGFKYTNLINTANYLTTVNNCIFKSNTPYNTNSYLIDTTGSDFSIANSEFTSNTAKLVNFETSATRGAITGTTFTSNTVGSGNSMIYINSKSSTVSGSTFKSSNTGGTYKNIYGTEDFTLTGNTFEGVAIGLNSVTTVTYPNNPTVSGTFNYGVNKAYNIPVTANNELLPNVARSNDATTFTYSWDTPLPDTYTLTFATTDSEGNKYTYTSTPNSVSTTVNRISTVYISPAGTGTGASASDPTNWDNVANVLTDTGSVVFTAGTYKLNGKTISKSWKLSNSGNVIIDAENNGRIFTINANNVEITGITFKNGKVSGNQGSAISWTGTGGKITNSIFNENTGVPISSTNDLTITNTQMKNQISLTKSNINWGATETVKGTFSHSAPSTVTVMFNGNSQGSFSVSSKVTTATVAFTNPSTQAVGSYVVSLTEINNFQVILWSLNQIWSY